MPLRGPCRAKIDVDNPGDNPTEVRENACQCLFSDITGYIGYENLSPSDE
jgi:hypothetical protein